MHQKIQIILHTIHFSPPCAISYSCCTIMDPEIPLKKLLHDSCLTTGVKKIHDSPLSKTHSRTVFLYKRWNIKMDPYYIHLYNMKYESRYGL